MKRSVVLQSEYDSTWHVSWHRHKCSGVSQVLAPFITPRSAVMRFQGYTGKGGVFRCVWRGSLPTVIDFVLRGVVVFVVTICYHAATPRQW